MSAPLRIRLLGSFEITKNGRRMPLPSRPAQALLAYLVLYPGQHRRETLAADLWPKAGGDNSRAYLRNNLFHLRKQLGKDAVPPEEEDTVGLDPELDLYTDVGALLAASKHPPSVDALVQIMSECSGELLPGFYEEWVEVARRDLADRTENLFQHIVGQLQQQDRVEEQIIWSKKWLAFDPSAEPAMRALMQAYAESGNVAKVSRIYREYTQRLKAEYDVAPSAETRDLYHSLVNGRQPSARGGRKTRKALPAPPAGAPPAPADRRRLLVLGLALVLGSYLLGAGLPERAPAAAASLAPQAARPTLPLVFAMPSPLALAQAAEPQLAPGLSVSATSNGKLAFANQSSGDYQIVELDSLFVKAATFADEQNRLVVLAYEQEDSSAWGDFFLVDLTTDTVQQLTYSSENVPKGQPALSPTRNELLYPDGGAVRLLDLATGSVTTVVPSDGGLSWIVAANWAPDGERIVYLRETPACTSCPRTVQIAITDRESSLHNVVYSAQNPELIVGSIGFSPDGTQVGYVDSGHFYVINLSAEGQPPRRADVDVRAWLPNHFPQWP